MNCPFCDIETKRIILQNEVGLVLRDNYPISPGHTLVVPRIHLASIFDFDLTDQIEMWKLVNDTREQLIKELHPHGLNVGINDGKAAGQTVAHAHIHLIPRHQGDVEDPRGGVRWIIPGKAKYW